MKKTINLAFLYAIFAMIGGVFYREFTKLSNFEGVTTLSVIHTHLLMLGMFMFLIVALLQKQFAIQQVKKYRYFMIFYNFGVCLTVIMLLVRGILQVQMTVLTKGLDAMISGFAGIGHISLGIGIIFLFLTLKEQVHE